MIRVGNRFNGSPSKLNSGQGNFEIITERPDNTTRNYYKFEFTSAVAQEVVVKINGGSNICLKDGYFATEPYDGAIWSFVIVTPNVEFYWLGGY